MIRRPYYNIKIKNLPMALTEHSLHVRPLYGPPSELSLHIHFPEIGSQVVLSIVNDLLQLQAKKGKIN